jgi:hypothetical protein
VCCIQANLAGLRRASMRRVSFGLTRLLTQNYSIGSATALNQYPNFSPPISFASPVDAPFSLPTTTAQLVLDSINDMASLQTILQVGNPNVYVDAPSHSVGQQQLNFQSVRCFQRLINFPHQITPTLTSLQLCRMIILISTTRTSSQLR